MKKFYILLVSFLIAVNAYSQCSFTVQSIPQGSCDTTCNSFLNISANGGNGPHYLFLNGSFHSMFTTFGNIGPLCPGFYTYYITDSLGCTFLDSIDLTPTPLSVFINFQDPTCTGCNNGSAAVTVLGGGSPYTYQWSNGANTQFISGLDSGTYCVTISDAWGCTATSCVTLVPLPCNFVLQIMPNTICDTICNTFVTVFSASGGGLYYAFLNGVFHSIFTSVGFLGPLCPGVYSLLLTDSASCLFTDTFAIMPSISLSIVTSVQNPSCLGCNDGVGFASASGGTPPYTYIWSNGDTGTVVQGLSAGVYCVTVIDQMQCMQTDCFSLGTQTGFSLISGTVYFDVDTSGSQSSLEPGANGIQIQLSPGGYTAWTSVNGHYFVSVPNGTYTVSVVLPPNWIQTSLPANYNVTVNDTILYGNNFGLLPDSTFISAQINITAGIPRCNWGSYYNINYKNMGLILAHGEIIFNKDPLVTFVSSSPAPTNISGNLYTWTFDSLYPFQNKNINIQVTMPAAGNVLNSSAIINLHDNLSSVIFSDTVYKTQTVTCAYDPNDKQMIPEGITAQNIVPLNTLADYTIRFQNTGNDTAFVVILKDTLSGLLDLGTFEIVAASHEMYAQLDPGGILTFTFDNILLPDSNVNEPLSHGFVRYRIRPGIPTTDPTVITNTAYIYFDQNPAVVTNTTLTTFSDNLLSVAEIKGGGIIKAYPNPFNEEVVIEFEKNVNAKAEMFDYQGRITKNYAIFNTSSFVISRNDLKNGLYLLKITTEDGSTTLKLIVK
ncbi:MAG: DUF7619 domain-containing protein [Bacteroidia bacterium]